MPYYVLIAGVNGAGKSTLFHVLDDLHEMPRVNIDEIVKESGDWRDLANVTKSGKTAVNRIKDYFLQNRSFNQETTLCGKSITNNIMKAKHLGYRIIIHYVGVSINFGFSQNTCKGSC